MTTHYIWDFASDSYLMEQDGDGNTTAVYTTEPVPYGRVISQRRGDTTNFYHYDGQGSTRQLTDQSGNVTDEYTYSAFGETVASSRTTVNPFHYVGSIGYYHDVETTAYYVRRRTYDVATGQWISQDPVGVENDIVNYGLTDGGSVYLSSSYVYSNNNPPTFADPAGLQIIKIPPPGPKTTPRVPPKIPLPEKTPPAPTPGPAPIPNPVAWCFRFATAIGLFFTTPKQMGDAEIRWRPDPSPRDETKDWVDRPDFPPGNCRCMCRSDSGSVTFDVAKTTPSSCDGIPNADWGRWLRYVACWCRK